MVSCCHLPCLGKKGSGLLSWRNRRGMEGESGSFTVKKRQVVHLKNAMPIYGNSKKSNAMLRCSGWTTFMSQEHLPRSFPICTTHVANSNHKAVALKVVPPTFHHKPLQWIALQPCSTIVSRSKNYSRSLLKTNGSAPRTATPRESAKALDEIRKFEGTRSANLPCKHLLHDSSNLTGVPGWDCTNSRYSRASL